MQTYTRIRRSHAGVGALALAVAAGLTIAAPAAQAAQPPATVQGDLGASSSAHTDSAAQARAAAQAMSEGYGLTVAQQQAVDAAVLTARKTGKAVPISALTTETSQVTAEPDGKLALTENTLPVRALKDNAWVAVDTTLHRNANGSYSPAATAYANVALSAGGSGPLAVTTTESGASYAVTWPTVLPAPVVSGSSATYTNVLSGVDLKVSATVGGGFSEVLVVHDARAAANPALSKLELAVHSSGVTKGSGSTVGSAAGGLALSISGASMWDSNTAVPADAAVAAARASTARESGAVGTPSSSAPTQAQLDQIGASDPSSAAAPGYAANQAPLGVAVTGNALVLTPSKALLADQHAVYPVYIDPTLSWQEASGGAPAYDEVKQDAPCNSQSYYKDTGMDDNSLGVGYAAGSCGGWQNTYYQWSLPPQIWGAHIGSAQVQVTENWQASFSCSTSRTVTAHLAGGIGSGTDYNNQPGPLTGSSAYSNAQSVGAAWNASGCTTTESSKAGFDFQSPVQTSANNHSSQLTVELTGDSSTTDFSRFTDNPSLVIKYDHNPNTPAASQLTTANGASNTVACASAAPYPFIGKSIATNTVSLVAGNITSPDGDQLRANFNYWTSASSTHQTGASADNLASGATAKYSLPSSFTSTLTSGETVYWDVQTTNGTYTSGWSPTCAFTAEPTSPDAPTIAPNSTYPAGIAVTDAGTSATFAVSGSSTGADTTGFYYNLDSVPAASGTPASEIAPITTSATGLTDSWPLNASSGTSAADSSGTNTATLQSGASFAADPGRGYVLATSGTSTSYAQSTTTSVNTAADFSVSAWVKLTAIPTANQTALSQDTSLNSGFYLQYETTDKAWAFTQFSANSTTHTSYHAHGASTPAAGVWYQLTGVYTKSTGLMQLYVDGALAGTATNPSEYAATGDLAIGRSFYSGSNADFFHGDISDVQTYSSALTSTQAASLYNTATADITITPYAPGPHTLYVDAIDGAGDISATASYSFIAAQHATATCASLSACYNNIAVSSNTAMTQGAADGGNSFSATDWTNAGWTSNGHITVDGASLSLPTYGTGHSDNALAYGQSVTCATAGITCAVSGTGSSSLVFLVTATRVGSSLTMPSSVSGNETAPYIPAGTPVTGTYYDDLDGSGSTLNGTLGVPTGCVYYTGALAGTCYSYVMAVPDWVTSNTAIGDIATMAFPDENTQSGTANTTKHPKVYAFSVPLIPGQTISSITLPDVSNDASGSEALHVFSLGTRDTTAGTVEAGGTTVSAATGDTWTGAWASDTEGDYAPASGSYGAQSVRILLQPTVTGSTVRIKLDNSLGTTALAIGHLTIASTTGTAASPTAATSTAPVALTFGGSQSTTVPAGAMVYSDPLSYSMVNDQWVAVSFYLSSTSVPALVQHSWATDAYEYMSPVNSADATMSSAATAYTAGGFSSGTYTNLVTGLDVQTAGEQTQVVIGDNLIDAWEPNTAPLSANNGAAQRLSDIFAAAGATTPSGYSFGVVNAGIESNQILAGYADTINGTTGGTPVGGPSLLARIDRDVLDEPGVTNTVMDEGLEDVLAEQPTTADDVTTDTSAFESGALTTLFGYLGDLDAQATLVTAIGMTPCIGYAGDGAASGNDPCTADVDAVRTSVNDWLEADGPEIANYAYVEPDTTIGTPATATYCPAADTDCTAALSPLSMVGTSRNNAPSDPVNLTNAATGALANAILAPQDIWELNDGTGASTAADNTVGSTGNLNNTTSTGSLYLAYSDPSLNPGGNPLTLNGTQGTNYTWPTATVGTLTGQTVLSLDGTSGYATTSGAVLDTTGSYSISAWVNLSQIPTGYATIAAQAGTQASGFYLQYDPDNAAWCLNFMSTDTADPPGAYPIPCASTAPTAHTWYHVVATYNATTNAAVLYVNGTQAGSATITDWSATGPLLIGADQYDANIGDFFPGEISDIQTFNYALSAPQITALYHQIN
ncbi:LamG-like jellyroll fold domain-containing protein [Actinospica robiniae]|uniref:LamG-like jellyroll fold domain-containing protein n=1 Tax=Actinospica robiniae TaxID=304901 RepID=UPI0003FA4976|nr:LamG-like jellyroll fold domain-containing protein [Actinospica robiniae]